MGHYYFILLLCSTILATKKKKQVIVKAYEHEGIYILYRENRKQGKQAVGIDASEKYYKVNLLFNITGKFSVDAKEDTSKSQVFHDLKNKYIESLRTSC